MFRSSRTPARRSTAPRRRSWSASAAALMVVLAMVAAACTVPPPDPGGPDPELEALLSDPDFIAQLGETDEERAEILAEIRKYLDASEDWTLDPAEIARMTAERQEYLDALVAQQAAEDAVVEQAAQDERKRLDALQNGPTVEEIDAELSDGSEDYDFSTDSEHWSSVDGIGEIRETSHAEYTATLARVRADIAQLIDEGTFYELIKDPKYIPPGGAGHPQYEALWEEEYLQYLPPQGACKDRAGGRKAPKKPTMRPGTIYSPRQNTFAGTPGYPDYVGDLHVTGLAGQQVLVVEGHLGNLDTLALPAGSIMAMLRARISIHKPNGFDSKEVQHPWNPGDELLPGDVQVMCYTDDYGLATGEPIRRAMFRAYVPWNIEGTSPGQPLHFEDIEEPLFEVKAAVSENWGPTPWFPTAFFGADMRTVYLGDEPLGYNSTFENGGFGVSAGRGVIIDDNATTGDDLESTLRPPLSNGIMSALSGLDGTSDWVLGKNGGAWGWLGFHINNSNPTTPNVDIQWDPTKLAGANDDEYRLRGVLSMDDWLIEGYMSLPWAAAGLIPCYFNMKIDFSASVYAAVDINDTAPTMLQPEIEVGPVSLNVHNMFAQPIPLGCNTIYLFKFTETFADKLNEKLPDINEDLEAQLEVQPNIDNVVPATIPIGGGQNMQTLFAGWNDTCPPYGCNGHKAGDMAMSWAGLEASGDIRFTDTKGAMAHRRFPVSYSPVTAGTANDRVRKHFGDQNWITDFGAWINPSVLNQALRVVAEHGRLDLDLSPTTDGWAVSPPIYLDKPVAADKPLGLYVPHLRMHQTVEDNLFAVDVFAAIGVGFDPLTRKLDPASVSPNDPGLRIGLHTLRCESTAWAFCVGFADVATDVVNWVGNTVLNPMLEASIGEVKIPNTGSFDLSGLQVLNEDGHLGIRTSVGAKQLRAWGGINASTYSFDTYYEGIGGTGEVTYDWTIRDAVTNAVIFTSVGPEHQFTGFDTSALTVLNIGFGIEYRAAKATITASRDGDSTTGTHTVLLTS